MNYILFDDHSWDHLLPLSFTRPVSELRIGILKIREKWEKLLDSKCSFLTREYLRLKYPPVIGDDNVLINSCLLPDKAIIDKINHLHYNVPLVSGERMLAIRLNSDDIKSFNVSSFSSSRVNDFPNEVRCVDRPWKIFLLNGEEIMNDFTLLTKDRKSVKLSPSNNLISAENIFAEDGVKAEFVTINASLGPVYLGRNSEIMEGAVIRGPFALCENARVKLAAKIYGQTTIGPSSQAGGEIKNSVIQAYTNKSHDGYLGNSVLGEWCNLGADTNTSNKKNNFAEIMSWSYPEGKFINTGLQFCGLIMADHSKCGINTMFNTGTVVGVNCNIFGSGYPGNFIPSFSWGGPGGYTVYTLNKALEVAERVMLRHNLHPDKADIAILTHIFQITENYRTH